MILTVHTIAMSNIHAVKMKKKNACKYFSVYVLLEKIVRKSTKTIYSINHLEQCNAGFCNPWHI